MGTSSPYACRLIVDPPLEGALNMALDERLLDEVVAAGRPAWRFYRWAEPTISLGYFQFDAARQAHQSSRACAIVRRPTGGGAIVHDAELTYGFVVPAAHPLAADALSLYRAVHGALVEALVALGVQAEIATTSSGLRPADEPFLCFQRHAIGDVFLNGRKIAGSAQRRAGEAILQHGSVLLHASAAAPELPGLRELAGQDISDDGLIAAWRSQLARTLSLTWNESPWDAAELQAAERLAAQKYRQPHWNLRR